MNAGRTSPLPLPRPFYVTTADGQIRAWRVGAGPDLAVLGGLTLAAAILAARAAAACPGSRVTVFEPPGLGGSAAHEAVEPAAIAAALAEAISLAGIDGCALAAADLAGALLPAVAAGLRPRPGETLWLDRERALAWAAAGIAPPDLAPRTDGTHLTALWSFLRDRHVLKADDPSQPDPDGEPIPSAAELDATLIAAAVAPERYGALWNVLAAALGDGAAGTQTGFFLTGGEGESKRSFDTSLRGQGWEHTAEMSPPRASLRACSALSSGEGKALPATRPLPDNRLWHQEVGTARGRMHLRRAGGAGRPLLVIPTGGGSSAQFAPVVQGLARDRQVFAVDYLGNGLSEKPDRPAVTIADLAEDMAALIDSLGFPDVDVWGSHTGAVAGLELALRHPGKVGRLVMEGPVFVAPDFQTDLLARYFPAIVPDGWGRHLQLVWNWRRDMFLFWPWYRAERAAARRLGLPTPQHLHDYAIGILESGPTYDGAYRAAFSYDTARRLPGLTRPALVTAGPNDMLVNALAETRALGLPNVEVRETPTTVWWPDPDPADAAASLAIYEAFLRG